MDPATGLTGLFISSFISSTLLPGGSELVLTLLDQQGTYSAMVLLTVATAGNTLGGMTSWWLGDFLSRRMRPLNEERQKAVARMETYGAPLLLLSWLPVIGDPLCVAAGWLRVRFLWALLFIAIGKAARYLFLLLVF